MITTLANIPLWVAPLFLGLLFLGLRATRERSASPLILFALPLLGLLGLSRAMGLPQAETAVTALLAAGVLGAVLGYRVQGRWIIASTAKRVQVRGEWLTLTSMMAIFLASFLTGALTGMDHALVQTSGFAAGFGTVSGLCSGLFLGRALRVGLWPVTPATA